MSNPQVKGGGESSMTSDRKDGGFKSVLRRETEIQKKK